MEFILLFLLKTLASKPTREEKIANEIYPVILETEIFPESFHEKQKRVSKMMSYIFLKNTNVETEKLKFFLEVFCDKNENKEFNNISLYNSSNIYEEIKHVKLLTGVDGNLINTASNFAQLISSEGFRNTNSILSRTLRNNFYSEEDLIYNQKEGLEYNHDEFKIARILIKKAREDTEFTRLALNDQIATVVLFSKFSKIFSKFSNENKTKGNIIDTSSIAGLFPQYLPQLLKFLLFFYGLEGNDFFTVYLEKTSIFFTSDSPMLNSCLIDDHIVFLNVLRECVYPNPDKIYSKYFFIGFPEIKECNCETHKKIREFNKQGFFTKGGFSILNDKETKKLKVYKKIIETRAETLLTNKMCKHNIKWGICCFEISKEYSNKVKFNRLLNLDIEHIKKKFKKTVNDGIISDYFIFKFEQNSETKYSRKITSLIHGGRKFFKCLVSKPCDNKYSLREKIRSVFCLFNFSVFTHKKNFLLFFPDQEKINSELNFLFSILKTINRNLPMELKKEYLSDVLDDEEYQRLIVEMFIKKSLDINLELHENDIVSENLKQLRNYTKDIKTNNKKDFKFVSYIFILNTSYEIYKELELKDLNYVFKSDNINQFLNESINFPTVFFPKYTGIFLTFINTYSNLETPKGIFVKYIEKVIDLIKYSGHQNSSKPCFFNNPVVFLNLLRSVLLKAPNFIPFKYFFNKKTYDYNISNCECRIFLELAQEEIKIKKTVTISFKRKTFDFQENKIHKFNTENLKRCGCGNISSLCCLTDSYIVSSLYASKISKDVNFFTDFLYCKEFSRSFIIKEGLKSVSFHFFENEKELIEVLYPFDRKILRNVSVSLFKGENINIVPLSEYIRVFINSDNILPFTNQGETVKFLKQAEDTTDYDEKKLFRTILELYKSVFDISTDKRVLKNNSHLSVVLQKFLKKSFYLNTEEKVFYLTMSYVCQAGEIDTTKIIFLSYLDVYFNIFFVKFFCGNLVFEYESFPTVLFPCFNVAFYKYVYLFYKTNTRKNYLDYLVKINEFLAKYRNPEIKLESECFYNNPITFVNILRSLNKKNKSLIINKETFKEFNKNSRCICFYCQDFQKYNYETSFDLKCSDLKKFNPVGGLETKKYNIFKSKFDYNFCLEICKHKNILYDCCGKFDTENSRIARECFFKTHFLPTELYDMETEITLENIYRIKFKLENLLKGSKKFKKFTNLDIQDFIFIESEKARDNFKNLLKSREICIKTFYEVVFSSVVNIYRTIIITKNNYIQKKKFIFLSDNMFFVFKPILIFYVSIIYDLRSRIETKDEKTIKVLSEDKNLKQNLVYLYPTVCIVYEFILDIEKNGVKNKKEDINKMNLFLKEIKRLVCSKGDFIRILKQFLINKHYFAD